VEFRILGPLEVVEDRRRVEISGANTRAVLAELLLNADRPVATATLIETVWGRSPPESAPAMLRNAVSQLRRQLGDVIETTPGGYRLTLGTHTLDARRFAELLETARDAARSGDNARASEQFHEAFSLWRGRPLDGVARNGEFEAETAALEELHHAALLDRIDVDLRLGRNESTVVAEIERLVDAEPYNERLRAQLMTALYRVGRQADALAAYQDARRTLAHDLGLEPGEPLRELERLVLRHDPLLEAPKASEPLRKRFPRLGLAATAAVVAVGVATAVIVATRGDGGTTVVRVSASTVAVVDPVSGRVASGARLGGTPTAIATDGHGAWAATANRTLVHLSTNGAITESYGLGFAPIDVAVERGTVWAASRGYLRRVARLRVGDLVAYELHTRVTRAGQAGRELHVAADAGGAWVGDGDSGIYRLDGATARLVAIAPDGLGSQHGGELVIGSGSVWVSDASHSGVVTRLDRVTGGEVASITLPVDSETNGPATFGAGALWTMSRGETTLWRIDADANAVTQTVRVGVGTVGLAFGDGAIWAVNSDRMLLRIDPHTGRTTKTWRFSRAPVDVAASNGRVWVAFS
jgi:DNA-binding SARP family transcriptional activator